MINPTSLRIGNIIYNMSGDIDEVTSIGKQYIAGKDGVHAPTLEVRGVELTKDWLVKFGFKPGTQVNYDRNVFYSTGGLIEMQILKVSGWVLLGKKMERVPEACEYVHQLQNLYFALCGTELALTQTA